MTAHDEMSIWDLYETDMTKEVEGFWHAVSKKINVKMARAGGANLAFSKAMERKTRPHRKRGGAFEGDEVDVELANELMREEIPKRKEQIVYSTTLCSLRFGISCLTQQTYRSWGFGPSPSPLLYPCRQRARAAK